jgi:hypothetical protein
MLTRSSDSTKRSSDLRNDLRSAIEGTTAGLNDHKKNTPQAVVTELLALLSHHSLFWMVALYYK